MRDSHIPGSCYYRIWEIRDPATHFKSILVAENHSRWALCPKKAEFYDAFPNINKQTQRASHLFDHILHHYQRTCPEYNSKHHRIVRAPGSTLLIFSPRNWMWYSNPSGIIQQCTWAYQLRRLIHSFNKINDVEMTVSFQCSTQQRLLTGKDDNSERPCHVTSWTVLNAKVSTTTNWQSTTRNELLYLP
jgi:hypothetical protein